MYERLWKLSQLYVDILWNCSMGQFLKRGCGSPNCYTESVDVERLLSSGSKQLSKRNNVDFKLYNRLVRLEKEVFTSVFLRTGSSKIVNIC